MLAFKLNEGTFIRYVYNAYMMVYGSDIPLAGNFYLQHRFARGIIDPFSGVDTSLHSFARGIVYFVGWSFIKSEIRVACRKD